MLHWGLKASPVPPLSLRCPALSRGVRGLASLHRHGLLVPALAHSTQPHTRASTALTCSRTSGRVCGPHASTRSHTDTRLPYADPAQSSSDVQGHTGTPISAHTRSHASPVPFFKVVGNEVFNVAPW